MAESIEAARRELSGHLVGHVGDGTHPRARCCLPFADAYALAVLDEAFEEPVLVDSIYVARRGVDTLRARIKALGK